MGINIKRKVTAAAFSPDKATFAISTVAFSTDGKYVVSGSNDGNISFWTPEDKMFKLITKAHYQGVLDVVFTKDALASIGADNCLKIWKLGAPEPAAASAAYLVPHASKSPPS